MNLDQKLLRKFIKLAAEQLEGEWLLVGGTVLPLLGANHRSTVDIDFVGLGRKERAQQLELMKIAEQLDLPVDIINSAAAFFVDRHLRDHKRQTHDKKHLVLLKAGKKANIYRPDTELYFSLKLGRFSDSDLSDCREWLQFFQNKISKAEYKKLARLVYSAASENKQNSGKSLRLQELLGEIRQLTHI